MNLGLLDPFALAQEYPESLKYTLKSGHSTCQYSPCLNGLGYGVGCGWDLNCASHGVWVLRCVGI